MSAVLATPATAKIHLPANAIFLVQKGRNNFGGEWPAETVLDLVADCKSS